MHFFISREFFYLLAKGNAWSFVILAKYDNVSEIILDFIISYSSSKFSMLFL